MFENVGGGEVLLILIVILIFFGPKKIPELAQSLGKGIRKFNDAKAGIEDQVKTAMKEPLEAMKEPLQAITGAKQGFESHLKQLAEPLHAELKIPPAMTAPAQPIAAPQAPVPETLPRATPEG